MTAFFLSLKKQVAAMCQELCKKMGKKKAEIPPSEFLTICRRVSLRNFLFLFLQGPFPETLPSENFDHWSKDFLA